MNNYTVYIHETPNKKRYVGITSLKPIYRWNNGKGYKPNKHFYNAIIKYGWDNIKHCIYAQNVSKDEACRLEKELIKKYDTTNPHKGFNHSIGGDGGATGVKQSQATIEKRKAHRDYSTSWSKGKKFSEDHKRKISESHRGLKMSDETREKLRQAKIGRKPSCAGKPWSQEYKEKKSKAILCVETGIRYFGTMEAERQTKISHSNIIRCLKGRTEKAGGFHWEYCS